ncbi:DUF1878 family protein [Oceanobacillus indicireducens]|uniref:DUF1878 family protein n=1 Tax=Oceanobacillus indicireducens TaxID=1004261 RepID=A0A917Y173_9BACI|nr:DUF1878 family protein [Oceanobacillus indicireducens]GGN60647.1 hypothetical protein GCM10007971_24800 [Oceanobacillus indicireducens]
MKEQSSTITSFQIQLLSRIIDMDEYPFLKLVIEQNISEEEYDELFAHLKIQQAMYEEQKNEGLLDFSSLLIEFAGLLNEKLDPTTTIYALRKENYFPELMDEYIKILQES